MQQTNVISIDPTGNPKAANYSDIALTNLFSAHLSAINSERQAIWSRYQAMLLANAIIAVVTSGGRVLWWTVGLALCVLWFWMTVSGYRIYRDYIQTAGQFSWPELPTSVNSVARVARPGMASEAIGIAALLVVVLFGLVHLFFAWQWFQGGTGGPQQGLS